MSTNGVDAANVVKDTIYKASLYLDENRWIDWLDLCDESFHYAIKAFSPEIHYDMTYLDGDRAEMVSMVELLPKHNSDHSPLSRHTVVYTVEVDEANGTAEAISSFAVYQTQLDGLNSHVDAGESRLFLVGKYHDKFKLDGDTARFTDRVVRLDTRRLDKGTHWPI